MNTRLDARSPFSAKTAIITLGLLSAACSGDDMVVLTTSPVPSSTPASDESDSEAPDETPLYALQLTQLDPEDNYTTYILLADTVDLPSQVTLDRAREFPGYASIASVDGRLLIASATDPSVTSYTATPELDWVDGARVSFGAYGAQDAGFWNQFFLDDHTAYLTLEISSRIVWDPTSMEILELLEDTNLELVRAGLELEPTVSRQPRPPVPPVLRPFYYHDEQYFQFGAITPIAVYDPQTHEEAAVIDAPCPAVEVESRDEAGNAYFSAWTYGPELGMYGQGPALCVARISADNTVDESWNTDLRSAFDGSEVGVFRYMRDGKALVTALEPGAIQADFTGEIDEDVVNALSGDVWRLWLLDLETMDAKPVEGLDLMTRLFNWTSVDGRTFLMIPQDEWTNTKVVEIDTNGVATERFTTIGNLYDWVRVR